MIGEKGGGEQRTSRKANNPPPKRKGNHLYKDGTDRELVAPSLDQRGYLTECRGAAPRRT